MAIPTIYDVCTPREDILNGAVTDADFAADLAKVLNGDAPQIYQDAARFFANTHPTRGLKNLLHNVFGQLARNNTAVSSIFRLDTNYGGGKTHALIALAHVAHGMAGVANVAEFIDPQLLSQAEICVAAFDGENADPANGRPLGNGIRAHTPWGELAYALGGAAGYEIVRKSDAQGVAPGADTLRELMGGRLVLILMDELSVYLRKAAAIPQTANAAKQLTAFLTALFKAVETAPRAAMVYTLAIGKNDGKAVDAYASENESIARIMQELESVSARKATLLDPTEEDETVQVLRRRLFAHIDDAKARLVVDAYMRVWNTQKDVLASDCQQGRTRDKFYLGYPLHPELMDTLTEKTATIGNFQRVRGMLRILARLVERLWNKKPDNIHALHLYHIDPSFSPIRQEILTRWGQSGFAAALKADIAAAEGDAPSLAEQLDANFYAGLVPYATAVARTIFLHSLAFNEELKGATEQQLRYSILAPGLELGFIEDAIRRFRNESAYLDDKPSQPLRFLSEPNLTQIIRQRERQVDPQEIRDKLNFQIKEIFRGQTFAPVFFPALPNDIEDSSEKPAIAIIGYEATAVSVDRATVQIPDLVARLYRYKSSEGMKRLNLNNIVFLVADEARLEDMKGRMRTRLALEAMQNVDAQEGLADHQKNRLKERYGKSEKDLAAAVQQAYRHLFYPSRTRLDGAKVDLNHLTIDLTQAAARPGEGQGAVVNILSRFKLRLRGADPDSPEYLGQRTPLKNGIATTQQLHDEYRQNVALAILEDDSILKEAIRQGISSGDFVYRNGDLLCGKGDPVPTIEISDAAEVMTRKYALDQHIWPRPQKSPQAPPAGDGAQGSPAAASVVSERDQKYGGGASQGNAQKPETGREDDEVRAEGILREALGHIWEKARQKKFPAIAEMSIAVFDANDGFVLLGLLSGIGKCDKKARLAIDYASGDGSTCSLEFEGTLAAAQEIKAFFAPQLRAASGKDVEMTFSLKFPEGLSLVAASAEAFTARLTQVGAASAYVKAWARRGGGA